MTIPILAPAATLILWSLLVLLLMASTRFPALGKAGLSVGAAKPGTLYRDVESVLPDRVNWISHNYTHLMEQPTLFYAVVAVLALAGEGAGVNATLAWAYVGLRILHSLWQIMVNKLAVRITLFLVSSAVLVALAVNAFLATVF